MELQSEQINEIAKSLAQVQAELKNPVKDSDNPFFKSKYADLAGVWDSCRPILPKHGLSVAQTSVVLPEGPALVTTLMHVSGQWVRGVYPLTAAKQDPQGMGSAMTYARRYALSAIVGIAPEDDDGEAAMGRNQAESTAKTQNIQNKVAAPPVTDPGDFINPYGNTKGTKLRDLGEAEVRRIISYWETRQATEGKPLTGVPAQLVHHAKAFLAAEALKEPGNVGF